MGRSRRGLARGVIGCALGLAALAAPGAGQSADGRSGNVLLDVPYVAQSEAMCGAAAVVMTLRYWGDAAVQTEFFRPHLKQDGTGIETSVLERATAELGWSTHAFRGDLEIVVDHVRRGRPVVLLIEVDEDRYHYVTVVGVVNADVVFHDPAVSPYQRLEGDAFHQAWAGGRFWSMLVLPEGAGSTADAAAAMAASGPSDLNPEAASAPRLGELEPGLGALDPATRDRPCASTVTRGVALARGGDEQAARAALVAATLACPSDAVAHRELAGLHLWAARPEAAAVSARAAVDLDPTDGLAHQILAASYYLAGRDVAALDVWNRLDPVRVREVTSGAPTRTRQTQILGTTGIRAGSILTPNALRLARRRLSALPAATASRVDFTPPGVGDGSVVTVAVSERAPLPSPIPTAVRGLVGMIAGQRFEAHSGSPLRAGEMWTVEARWARHRRGIRVALAHPLRGTLPGVLALSGMTREEAYDYDGYALEERRRGEARFTSWVAPDLRLGASLAVDRWVGSETSAALGVDARLLGFDDHVTVTLGGEMWTGGAGPRFHRLAAELELRTKLRREGLVTLARIGGRHASEHAPRSLWPGAGIGTSRAALARAHRLLDEGRIVGALFGRGLAYAGIESVRWLHPGPLDVGVAAFVDTAWSGDRPAGIAGEPLQVDVGAGLRVGIGREATGRIDVGRGLRDGSTAISIGIETPQG